MVEPRIISVKLYRNNRDQPAQFDVYVKCAGMNQQHTPVTIFKNISTIAGNFNTYTWIFQRLFRPGDSLRETSHSSQDQVTHLVSPCKISVSCSCKHSLFQYSVLRFSTLDTTLISCYLWFHWWFHHVIYDFIVQTTHTESKREY